MCILLPLILLIATGLLSPLHELAAQLSHSAHNLCQSWVPASRFHDQYAAMVCGSSLSSSDFKSELKLTGLIHLMVVSGSHLIFLQAILSKCLLPKWAIRSVLLLYCFLTDLQAPAVRSFIALYIGDWNKKYRFYWTSAQTVMVSGTLTWVFAPESISSFSFLLSWGCALGLALAPKKMGRKPSPMTQHLFVWLLIYPLCLPLGPSHPVSILFNWCLAPFLGAILFPVCILIFFLPSLIPISDLIWLLTEKLLALFTMGLTPLPPHPVPILWLWVTLWSLHLIVHMNDLRKSIAS